MGTEIGTEIGSDNIMFGGRSTNDKTRCFTIVDPNNYQIFDIKIPFEKNKHPRSGAGRFIVY